MKGERRRKERGVKEEIGSEGGEGGVKGERRRGGRSEGGQK